MKNGKPVAEERKEAGTEDGRRPTDVPAAGEPPVVGPLLDGQRWSVARKLVVVQRIIGGESLDALSRELGVAISRLEAWRDRALKGMEESLKERGGDSRQTAHDEAMKLLGEARMEIEILRLFMKKRNIPSLPPRRPSK